MKIQDKFLVGFLVSSLLSILAIWVCLDLAQTAMRQSAIQNIAMQTNIAMGRIDQRLRQNLHWVECCAAHLASTAHLPVSGDAQTSGHSPDSPIGPSSLQQALSALSDRLRAEIQAKTVRDGNGAVDRFERIFAIDRDGMLIAATNEEADYPPWSNPSWWHKTRETGGCIQTVSSTAGAGEDEIVFAAAMRDSAGGFTGAIVYMMSASRTAALLERLREDFPCESVTLTLLDDRDAVICQASDVEAIRQELFPARRTKSELTSRPTKERQTQAHCEIDAYAISDSQAGQQCVGWHLRCDYDPQEVFRAASTFRRKAVAPALAFALIGLTLGLFMSRSITEPIHRLATAAKSISHGNLNGVVLVDSNDETRNLSECLHEMIDRLKSTIHDLEGEVGHRRDAEEQLAQINRTLIETVAELERGNRELQDVAYAAAHDLKTPLRGIATIAQWMVNDHGDTLPEPVREQIGLLHILRDDPPDLVVSGSNRGENVGFSTYISGTLGAATIAMLRGFPAIAVSVEIELSESNAEPVPYPSTVAAYPGAAEFTAALIRELSETSNGNRILPEHTVLNVNYPALEKDAVRGVRLAKTAYETTYRLTYRDTDTPGELRPHSTQMAEVPNHLHDTDVHWLSLGYITIGVLDGNRDAGDAAQVAVAERLSGVIRPIEPR